MRYLVIIFSVLLVLLCIQSSPATIIHVPAQQTTIQKGIDGSLNGDTVLVAAGRYVENIHFRHKAITVMSENGPEETTIDGDSAGPAVIINFGEDSTSVLQGFTVTRGYNEYGGGLFCYGSSPTIQDNYFVENACHPHKGGSAIYCAYGSNPKLIRNLIYHSDGAGAVFVFVNSHARLINNTICGNSWGGLSIQDSSSAYIENNIFCNNNPYGIHLSSELPTQVFYNDVYGQPDNYAGDISDQTGINGNISLDPLFMDTTTGHYQLNPTSPCVDAGDPADPVPPGGGTRIDMGAFETEIQGVIYYSHQVDDSDGNNNGVINPGEIILIPVTVKNYETDTVYGVTGTLRTEDLSISVTDSTRSFGDIGPGMTAVSMGSYMFAVNSLCPDSHQVKFAIELTYGNLTSISYFYVFVADTDFAISSVPTTLLIPRGDSGSFELQLTSLGGFRSQVSLNYSNLPPQASGAILPDYLIPTDTALFTIYTTPDIPCGIYPVTVFASSGGIAHELGLKFSICTRGDANEDGIINVGDVIYLINYLFKSGPAPRPPQAGDVSCDGVITISDVVLLIGYLFKGGSLPSC